LSERARASNGPARRQLTRDRMAAQHTVEPHFSHRAHFMRPSSVRSHAMHSQSLEQQTGAKRATISERTVAPILRCTIHVARMAREFQRFHVSGEESPSPASTGDDSRPHLHRGTELYKSKIQKFSPRGSFYLSVADQCDKDARFVKREIGEKFQCAARLQLSFSGPWWLSPPSRPSPRKPRRRRIAEGTGKEAENGHPAMRDCPSG
jgi:hypothetical protein